jgi:NSS family neurotransmitter:Na+ symporter
MSNPKTQKFATRLGVIATTVGSAVGLGNIWRFPYEAGVHGGCAFLLIYICFILILGIPVICAEFIIGRKTGRNISGAFRVLTRGRFWRLISAIGITAGLVILSFYSVVAGWTMEYIWQSICAFHGATTEGELHSAFDAFASSDVGPVAWMALFLFINYIVLKRGVTKGIERISNIMLPILFIILVAFCLNSLTMAGSSEGLAFLFKPDFSKITTDVLFGAMGQAFFSLSLGLGCLITYSSYFNKEVKLIRSATITASLDTLTAVLAGIMIFPAVFTYGMQPTAGPKLVFEVLPSIFVNMPGGIFWSTLFFVLLFVASLTSTISMSEISIAYFTREHGMTRNRATMLTIAIGLVFGMLCALSFGSLSWVSILGKSIFDSFDFLASNILLPLGGLIISVFTGWFLDRRLVKTELGMTSGKLRIAGRLIIFSLRWIAPICIAIVFIVGLL